MMDSKWLSELEVHGDFSNEISETVEIDKPGVVHQFFDNQDELVEYLNGLWPQKPRKRFAYPIKEGVDPQVIAPLIGSEEDNHVFYTYEFWEQDATHRESAYYMQTIGIDLQGLKFDAALHGSIVWPTGWEATLSVQLPETYKKLQFYTAFTGARDPEKTPHVEVELSALAFQLTRESPDPVPVEDGPIYEYALNLFLEKYPGKTAKDFPGVSVSKSRMQSLQASPHFAWYILTTQIDALDEIEICGKRFLRIKADIWRDLRSKRAWPSYIYANEKLLNGQTITVGDTITAIVMLVGRVNPRMIIDSDDGY